MLLSSITSESMVSTDLSRLILILIRIVFLIVIEFKLDN